MVNSAFEVRQGSLLKGLSITFLIQAHQPDQQERSVVALSRPFEWSFTIYEREVDVPKPARLKLTQSRPRLNLRLWNLMTSPVALCHEINSC